MPTDELVQENIHAYFDNKDGTYTYVGEVKSPISFSCELDHNRFETFKEELKELIDSKSSPFAKFKYFDTVGPTDGENIYCSFPGCKKHLKRYASETEVMRKGFYSVAGCLYCKKHAQDLRGTIPGSILKIADSVMAWIQVIGGQLSAALSNLFNLNVANFRKSLEEESQCDSEE